jgi:phage-related tail fiber protein
MAELDSSIVLGQLIVTENAKVAGTISEGGVLLSDKYGAKGAGAPILTTARAIAIAGDATGTANFDGSANIAISITLANTGVSASTYRSVTVNAKGLVTGGSNPTTIAGYGLTDAVSTSDVVTTATANKILKLDGSAKLPASITGNADGNAATATKLATARNIAITGDLAWNLNFDGSANVTAAGTLSNTGVTASTYRSVTVDAKGRVTGGTNPTTIADYGLTDAVSTADVVTVAAANKILKLDANSKLPANITGNADGTAANATKLATARSIAITGDMTWSVSFDGSANVSAIGTLKNTGTPGTYTKVTTDAQGRVTAGSNPTTLAGYGISDGSPSNHNHTLDSLSNVTITTKATGDLVKWNGSAWVNFAPTYISGNQTITLTGDVTGTGTTSIVTSLANVGTAGTYTKVTTDEHGRVTAGSTPTTLAGYSIADACKTTKWTAISTGLTWSRLFSMTGSIVVGHSFILSITGTRNAVVFNATFLVNTGHSSVCNIVQLNSTSYSTFKLRGEVDSNGDGFISIFDDANAITNATTQTLTVVVMNLRETTITPNTTFVDGTVTTGYTVSAEVRSVIGASMVATNFVGNASTATKLATARAIAISGDMTGTANFDGTGDISISGTLANTGVSASTYRSVTVDSKGRVTGGTNPTTIATYGLTDAVSTSDVVTTATANKILKLDGSAKLPASITGDAATVGGKAASAFLLSDAASEQIASVSMLKVHSTTTTERFEIEFNETLQSLDFCYYAS